MKADAPPPHIQLIQMGTGYWISRMLYFAAKIGLADLLADGPKSADDLADKTGTHAKSLSRLMRTLASIGVLSDEGDGKYGLTPLGDALKDGAPGAARYGILAMSGNWAWKMWEHFEYSMKTGESASVTAHGVPAFEAIARDPGLASHFSGAMVCFHGEEPAAVAEAYDFSQFETIADVGGATGNLLGTILAAHPEPEGILFDLPHVTVDAPKLLESKGVAGRVTIESGSFFEEVPKGADAYLASHIIHDWSEEQCLAILGNIRAAMGPESKLLLIEMVLPEGDEPHPGKILDMVMLVMPGGQERTAAEYGELLAKAGLKMTMVVPTDSSVSIVEAVKA